MPQIENDDDVLFARSGTSHPLGKLTAVVKTVVPDVVEDTLVERARAARMTVTELHRKILCWWTCADEMDRLIEQRRQVTAMNWSVNGAGKSGAASR